MRGRRVRTAAATFALLGALAGPGPAQAQSELGCAPDLGIDARIAAAPTVFTGTVRALGNKGRQATVEVIRVWQGGPLPRRVEVQGTIATQAKVVTALDRLYARDRTYLFLPTAGGPPRFRENRCSATRELTADLAAKGPADGGAVPQGEGVPLSDRSLGRFLPLMIGVPAFVVLGTLLILARRRTSPAGPPRRPPAASPPP